MNALDDIRIRANVDHVTDAEALEVIRWCHDWASDVEASAVVTGMDNAALLRYCDAAIDGGIAFVLSDVRRLAAEDRGERGYRHPDADAGNMSTVAATIAARFAKTAADSFEYDESGDDVDNAQRVADILRDLAPEDVAPFLVRIFGTPEEERHATRELRELQRAEEYGREHPYAGTCGEDDARADRIRDIREDARREAGFPDVARVLLFEYRDIIEPLAFAGHEADEARGYGESTNLNAYREARAALDKVNALNAHAFGGNSLQDHVSTLTVLADAAIGAAIEAVSWAVFNNANPLMPGDIETGMPRGE